jgi:glycosyltransferase involved in cell wall biosynthesis
LRILFVHNGRERFVLDDLRLLSASHRVTDWYQPRRTFNPARLLRLIWQHDIIFCWFAGWHSFAPVLLARVLRKPSVVVVGGYDTANLPEANYGSQRGGLPRFVARRIIGSATRLITASEAAKREAISNAGANPRKITVLYHGVDPYSASNVDKRENIALTVGGVWRENLLRKGLLPFVQAARLLPDVRFIHAGKAHDNSIDILKRQAGPNVEFRGFVTDAELASLYETASVYVQASLHEGFGLSVAEAMSAGCVPIVARSGAIPEVVGECGIYSSSNSPQDLAIAIKAGLSSTSDLRLKARQRVLDKFSMQRHAARLQQIIDSLFADRLP